MRKQTVHLAAPVNTVSRWLLLAWLARYTMFSTTWAAGRGGGGGEGRGYRGRVGQAGR
jgi:hypothetical protein